MDVRCRKSRRKEKTTISHLRLHDCSNRVAGSETGSNHKMKSIGQFWLSVTKVGPVERRT